jgi:hypothetical protein
VAGNSSPLGMQTFAPYGTARHNFTLLRATRHRAHVGRGVAEVPARFRRALDPFEAEALAVVEADPYGLLSVEDLYDVANEDDGDPGDF